MARRPSVSQIRARQRRLLEYLASTDKTPRQAAKEFRVTPRQLEQFVSTKTPTVRRNFNRSPVTERLYQAGEEKGLRARAKTQGRRLVVRPLRQVQEPYLQQIRTTPGFDPAYVTRQVQSGEQIQNLYTTKITPQYLWAVYTREHNLPIGIKSIKLLRRNRKISSSEYNELLTVWKDIYNIQQERYESYID